jgi:hypothetical protein
MLSSLSSTTSTVFVPPEAMVDSDSAWFEAGLSSMLLDSLRLYAGARDPDG